MTERDIFIAALQKETPAQRQALLDEACAGRHGLREAVEGLLRLYATAGSFLEGPALAPAAPGTFAETVTTAEAPAEAGPGTYLGPFKLIEPIGEGGMGTVWLAQQTEPVKRLVAVKLIKAGMDSRQVIARFEAERQALALMDHANIARVLDAGPTSAGRPYFVMDLVKGVPITRYCDEHHLTPRRRLELFLPVCQAVQHAHQKGVIHRDLKPSNVLVALYDGKPVPKVIDFGVAKAAGETLTEKTLVTGFGALVGTLEYMSPEQAEINQLDIDTRSDIYSLGVLLYELLTGSTPFTRKEMEEGGMLEMLRVIREQEPTTPSAKLSTAEGLPTLAANRGTEPARLTKLVRGELDWIVLKALEKDRNRRYDTASAFAADVQRYLDDQPVQACPPSAWYRFRKFARRNKAVLANASVVALAVALVTLVSMAVVWSEKNDAVAARKLADEKSREATSAQQSASEQRNLALETLNELTFAVQEEIRESEQIRAMTGEQSEVRRVARQLRQKVLDQAVAGLRRVQRSADNTRALDESMAAARVRMGEIYHQAGQREKAQQQFQLARDLAKTWVSDPSRHARAAWALALAHRGLGDVRAASGDVPAAQQHYEQSVQLLEPLATDLQMADARHDLAEGYQRLARLNSTLPNQARAREYYRKSLEHLEPWAVANPDNVRVKMNLYDIYFKLGKLSEKTTAREYFGKALQVAQVIAYANPERFEAQWDLWNVYSQLTRVSLELGELAAARDYRRKAVQLREVKFRGRLAQVHRDVLALYDYFELAEITLRMGDAAEARDCYEKALRVREAWAARDPANAKLRANLVQDYAKLAWLLTTRPEANVRDPDRAVNLAKRAAGLAPEEGSVWKTLGVAHYRAGDWKAAVAALDKFLELRKGADAAVQLFLAMAHRKLGDHDEARKAYEQAVEWLEKNKEALQKNQVYAEELRRFRAEAEEVLELNKK
jgi:serine/threonine protein kinase/Flp pilus assembly protein TadD